MTLTLEQFQKEAQPVLARLKQSGERLLLVVGEEVYEVRPAEADMETLLPKRSIIVGNPEDLVHLDWSAEWRP